MNDDLVEFLRARLDEDEAAAKAAAEFPGRHWDFSNGGEGRERDGILWDDDHANVIGWLDDHLACAAHAARHDPRRTLREVEAKRRIMGRHHANEDGMCEGCPTSEITMEPQIEIGECPELRDLAAVYTEHPDYQPGWKP